MLSFILLGAAFLIIAPLGYYAGTLLYKLKQQNIKKEQVRLGRVDTITDSIIVIVKAMQQQQCELSEGVIRIVRLLEALPISPQPVYRNDYPHTYSLFTEVSSFAILEERKQLPKKERMAQDLKRGQIESEFESKVLEELPAIKAFSESLREN